LLVTSSGQQREPGFDDHVVRRNFAGTSGADDHFREIVVRGAAAAKQRNDARENNGPDGGYGGLQRLL
jgi:hypothetical protein